MQKNAKTEEMQRIPYVNVEKNRSRIIVRIELHIRLSQREVYAKMAASIEICI